MADFLEEEPTQNEDDPLEKLNSSVASPPQEMEVLASMFPDLPAETLALVLGQTGHDVQAAIDMLLAEEEPASDPIVAKEVALDSETEFPSLMSAPKSSFQPPRTTNLLQLDSSKLAVDAEVESVEWVEHEDYDEYGEYEEVPDVNDGRSWYLFSSSFSSNPF